MKTFQTLFALFLTVVINAQNPGTKTIFNSWGYDGKTVSFEGFPIKMGKNRQDETFMTILEKKSGKDNFKLTSIYSFLSTEYSVNFNERSSTATMFGSVMRGSCY